MKARKAGSRAWILPLAILAIAVALAAILTLKAQRRADRQVSLTLAVDIDEPTMLASFAEVLSDFSTLNPRIKVSLKQLSPQAGAAEVREAQADVVVRTGPEPRGAASCFREAPVAWTGSLWVLAAHRDYLDEAASRQAGAVAALRSGEASSAQFELLLADAAARGLSPVTLGNSYGWPFLLWLQHWTAATAGPGAISALPQAPSAPAGKEAEDPYSALRPAFGDLMRWKRSGWFDQASWDKGWAVGLLPLDTGKAAFGLVSADMLSAISPKGRASLEYLPFPRRSQDGNWSIGSAAYLGVAAGSRELEASRLLVRFLSSPGVTSRLAELTARPFFAWDAKKGGSPTVIADWTSAAMSPAYGALEREFNPDK